MRRFGAVKRLNTQGKITPAKSIFLLVTSTTIVDSLVRTRPWRARQRVRVQPDRLCGNFAETVPRRLVPNGPALEREPAL